MNLLRHNAEYTSEAFRQARPKGYLSRRKAFIAGVVVLGLFFTFFLIRAESVPDRPAVAPDSAALLDAFRQLEVASVSDAIEQVTGRRMYMSHRMHALFPTHFAGFAVTVELDKQENHDLHALDSMLAVIDQGKKDSVYVMKIQDGENIAGMGGLMGTAMAARDFSGAVIDGGVRDVAYLRKIEFPVYATGEVPSTSVGHYRSTSNSSIVCDGVLVHPGDIVVADNDGVVVVPRSQASRVLSVAQQMDFKEHSMYPYITKMKSIEQAVKQFGRL